jgi:hypothetical protein
MFVSDIRKPRSMRLVCFSARRDGKTPLTLKSAIIDESGKLLNSASLHRKKRSGFLGLLFLPAIEEIFPGLCSCIVVLVTTELFRLPVIC